MIGRGAQGSPGCPARSGAGSRPARRSRRRRSPQQLDHVRALYDDICSHYGLRIGLRHARKHLGWALDVAAADSRRAGGDAEALAADAS